MIIKWNILARCEKKKKFKIPTNMTLEGLIRLMSKHIHTN